MTLSLSFRVKAIFMRSTVSFCPKKHISLKRGGPALQPEMETLIALKSDRVLILYALVVKLRNFSKSAADFNSWDSSRLLRLHRTSFKRFANSVILIMLSNSVIWGHSKRYRKVVL